MRPTMATILAEVLAVMLAVQAIGRAGPAVQGAGEDGVMVGREGCRAGRVMPMQGRRRADGEGERRGRGEGDGGEGDGGEDGSADRLVRPLDRRNTILRSRNEILKRRNKLSEETEQTF